MPVSETIQNQSALENAVMSVLQTVSESPEGADIVSTGQVYGVVATDGAVRVLLDPARLTDQAQQALAEFITPLVEAVPGVRRAVIKPRPQSVALQQQLPGIRHVVGVHSGKGGVGKSTLASNLAVALAAQGLRVGLLDADVYGPSVPTLLGKQGRATETEEGRVQPFEAYGVRFISLGLLLPAGHALLWRGSLVDQGLPQLFTDVDWGELDLLLIDLPPGTSDVHLAAARQVALSGIITVTAPGQVSLDDVRRGMEMFADVAVPCLGVVENMAGVHCGHCGHVGAVFGEGGGSELAASLGLPLLASLPFEPEVAQHSDAGAPVVSAAPEARVSKQFFAIATQLALRLGLNRNATQAAGEPA